MSPTYSQKEQEYARKLNFAQQQARLASMPESPDAPNQENQEGQSPGQETEKQPQGGAAGAAGQAAAALAGGNPEEKMLKEFAKQIPLGTSLLKLFPVLLWLLQLFLKTIIASWIFILIIPPLWFFACFFSIIGLRGIKIPLLPTQIPKTNAIELFIALFAFLVEISPLLFAFVGLITLVVWVKDHKAEALYKIFFGPLDFLLPLLEKISSL